MPVNASSIHEPLSMASPRKLNVNSDDEDEDVGHLLTVEEVGNLAGLFVHFCLREGDGIKLCVCIYICARGRLTISWKRAR